MPFAKSKDGVVDQVLQVDPATIWPPAMAALYRSAPAGVAVGWLDNGQMFAPPPTPGLTVAEFHQALYDHIDAFARADGWDNRVTFMQRAAFAGHWQAWAILFCEWVDACEVLALGLLSQVTGGEVDPPASVDEFISMLPAAPVKP